METEVSDFQVEKNELKNLCSEKQKELEVLDSKMKHSFDENKLLGKKLSESALELNNLKQTCEVQCVYCGEYFAKLTDLKTHSQAQNNKDKETQSHCH